MPKKIYNNILIATELSPISSFVVDRAKHLAKVHDAELSIVHAILPTITYASIYFTPEIQENLIKDAREKMAELGTKFKIKKSNQYVLVGDPKEAILDLAKEIKADLIIVGSHHRSWFSPLLGSTASNVVSRAECDVLTIPMRDIAKAHIKK